MCRPVVSSKRTLTIAWRRDKGRPTLVGARRCWARLPAMWAAISLRATPPRPQAPPRNPAGQRATGRREGMATVRAHCKASGAAAVMLRLRAVRRRVKISLSPVSHRGAAQVQRPLPGPPKAAPPHGRRRGLCAPALRPCLPCPTPARRSTPLSPPARASRDTLVMLVRGAWWPMPRAHSAALICPFVGADAPRARPATSPRGPGGECGRRAEAQ